MVFRAPSVFRSMRCEVRIGSRISRTVTTVSKKTPGGPADCRWSIFEALDAWGGRRIQSSGRRPARAARSGTTHVKKRDPDKTTGAIVTGADALAGPDHQRPGAQV